MRRPLTVAVVGIDGSGKTTLVDHLHRAIEEAGSRVRTKDWFRDKGFRQLATCFNDTLTMSPTVLAALHAGSLLAQRDVFSDTSVDVVLWDRYAYSSYASCCIRGAPVDLMRRLTAEFPVPDLVVHVVGEPRTCFDRIKRRGSSLRYYESGLDRLFRDRAFDAHARFDAGDFPPQLVEEVFVETMTEWNRRLEEIVPVDRAMRLVDFRLAEVGLICDQVMKALQLRRAEPIVVSSRG